MAFSFGLDRLVSEIKSLHTNGDKVCPFTGNLSMIRKKTSPVFCREYGSVKRVQLPTDRETGRLRGFGFVEMETEPENSCY